MLSPWRCDTIPATFPHIFRCHELVGGPWGIMHTSMRTACNMSLPALDAALGTVGVGLGATLRGLPADVFSDDLGKVGAGSRLGIHRFWVAERSR